MKEEHLFGELEKVSIAHIAASIEVKIETQCRFNCEKCLAIISNFATMRVAQPSLSSLALNSCQTTFDVCCLAHKHKHKQGGYDRVFIVCFSVSLYVRN